MTQSITPREQEMLSAFLDNALNPREQQRLESQLQTRPELRAALNDLRQTRHLLRQAPALRAPRNFTLTPEMAGLRTRPPRVYPAFQWAFALASFLFVLVLAGELVARTPGGGNPVAMAPAAESFALEEAPLEAMDAPPDIQEQTRTMDEEAVEESGAGNAEMAPASEETPGPQDSFQVVESPTPTLEPTFKNEPEGEVAEESIPSADEPVPETLLGPEPEAADGVDRDAAYPAPAPAPAPDFWASSWRIPQMILVLVILGSGLGLFLFRRKTML